MSLMLGRYWVGGGGMASGPAATLRELPRPVARMETAANPIAATAIGRRHIRAFPDLVPFSSMTAPCSPGPKTVGRKTSGLRRDVFLPLARDIRLTAKCHSEG